MQKSNQTFDKKWSKPIKVFGLGPKMTFEKIAFSISDLPIIEGLQNYQFFPNLQRWS